MQNAKSCFLFQFAETEPAGQANYGEAKNGMPAELLLKAVNCDIFVNNSKLIPAVVSAIHRH